MLMCLCWYYCFFQAEDGIRDKLVTGVQTCALPIFYGLVPFRAAWDKAVEAARARGLSIDAAKREVAAKARGLHLGFLAEASGWPVAEVHPWVERKRVRR